MSSAGSKPKRSLVFLTATLCLMYSTHLTLRTLQNQHSECQQHLVKSYAKDELTSPVATTESSVRKVMYDREKTDYFSCSDFDKIPNTTQVIKENMRGNRGISFIKVKINGEITPVVVKTANKDPPTLENGYKYNSAKREIHFLTKLKGIEGVPHIFASCVNETTIRYIVARINGRTFCNDNGTTVNCSSGDYLAQLVAESNDPVFAALSLAYYTAKLFRIFEERHLLFEDISGLNLMVSSDWVVHLADADSLVFYNDSRMFSKLACSMDEHCPGPMGNLWIGRSLNARIYATCKELKGICSGNKRCLGFDASLHACGIANWYLCRLKGFLKGFPEIERRYGQMCTCLSQPYPQHRCSFITASQVFHKLLTSYIEQTQ